MTTTRGALFVLAVCASLTACGGAQSNEADRLGAGGPAAGANPLAVDSPRDGVIKKSQASRAGLDGSPECQGQAAMAFISEMSKGEPARYMDGFVTDTAGYFQWNVESDGATVLSSSPPADAAALPPSTLHALCWYQGDFTVSGGDMGVSDAQARFVIISVESGPTGSSIQLLSSKKNAPAILAPAKPTAAEVASSAKGRSERRPQQPDGVTVVDG